MKYLPIAAAVILSACTAAAAGDSYSLTVNLPAKTNGQTAFLVNYDNGDKIDSVTVANGKAVFNGTLGKPLLARVVVDGNRFGNLILEKGTLTLTNGAVSGGAVNTSLENAMKGITDIQRRASQLPQDSTGVAAMKSLEKEYNNYIDSVIRANSDNPIGYMFFIEQAYGYDLPTLRKKLEQYPAMKSYERIRKLTSALEQKEKTMPGNKFIDFTIKNDTTEQKLSDYVGKGRYTLVDFWASWCGPCIRETKVLKQIREQFADKPLDILGVAVWDEPAKTEAAIKRHQLPWPQIINAQSVPTDLYGISGIPCIILFSPDGTIISRDLQGQDLIDSVAAALNAPAKAE